jgi:hypothetical protein
MSEETQTITICDGECEDSRHVLGRPANFPGTRDEARIVDGWVYRDSKDYCPECAKD